MDLSGQQRKKLQEAFIDAFPDKLSLEQMLLFGLDKHLDAIVEGGSLEKIVFNLIKTALAQGWIVDLIRTARKENPGNSKLSAIAGAQKGIIVTTRGFQSGAIQLAKSKGIALIIACDLKWEICVSEPSPLQDINLRRQNFIQKGMRYLNRATKLDEKRLSLLYARSAEQERGKIVKFNSATTNLDFMQGMTHAYVFVTNSVINRDVKINQITDQFFVLLREGIFSLIAIDSAYAISLGFTAKAVLLNVSGLACLLSWLTLPLPDSNVLCVLNEFNTFFESLPEGNFKQAFELLKQIKNFDNRWEFENVDRQNWRWQEIANWGWQEIAYALETPKCFNQTLKLAQKGEICDDDLDRLIVMVAERGKHNQAIAFANCIKSGLSGNQKRALALGRIASRIVETGNLVEAGNLFAKSLQIAQEDRDVVRMLEIVDAWGLESRGLAKYNEVLVEMALLAARANLVDRAIQIARSIKSESLQAETLAKLRSRAYPYKPKLRQQQRNKVTSLFLAFIDKIRTLSLVLSFKITSIFVTFTKK